MVTFSRCPRSGCRARPEPTAAIRRPARSWSTPARSPLHRLDVRPGGGLHLHGQLPGHPARHQRVQGVDQAVGAVGDPLSEPIDWDGNEVLFALGIAGYQGGHMDILSRIAIVFSDTDEVDKLVAASRHKEIYDLLNAVNQE